MTSVTVVINTDDATAGSTPKRDNVRGIAVPLTPAMIKFAITAFPKPDPIVQDMTTFTVADEQPYIYHLTSLAVEAERQGKGIDLAYAVSHLIWGGEPGWNEGNRLAYAVASAGLSLSELEQAVEQYDWLAVVNENHAALDAAGHWGVPTMVVNGEPFFGQDRIDTLRWRLEKLGLLKG